MISSLYIINILKYQKDRRQDNSRFEIKDPAPSHSMRFYKYYNTEI